MSVYKIGPYRRWLTAIDVDMSVDFKIPIGDMEGVGQRFSGRGKTIKGFYYRFTSASSQYEDIAWNLSTVDGGGLPTGSLANVIEQVGTADTWLYRELSAPVYLDENSAYFLHGVPSGDWIFNRSSGGLVGFTWQPPGENRLIYSTTGPITATQSGLATVDPNYLGFSKAYLGIWSAASFDGNNQGDWPIVLLNTDSSWMGLGYADDYYPLPTSIQSNFYPTFYNRHNIAVVGAGFGFWDNTGTSPDEDLRFRIIRGKDKTSTAYASVVGTSFTVGAKANIYTTDSAWVTTSLSSDSVYPTWDNGIFLASGAWYTIDFNVGSTYPFRMGGNVVADNELKNIGYDSTFSYTFVDGGSNYDHRDFPYYLEVAHTSIAGFYNTARPYIFLATVTSNNVSGHIYDYRNNLDSTLQAVVIESYKDGIFIRSTPSAFDGSYSISVATGDTVNLRPKWYDWEFMPQHSSYVSDVSGTRDFYCSSEPKWWGEGYNTAAGRLFAFREVIQFPTPHPTLFKGNTIRFPFQTGYQSRISTAGFFNEAVQHSMGQGITYREGKTHMCYISTAGGMRGATYNHFLKTTTEYDLPFNKIIDYYDSHFYPNICADNNNDIWAIHGGHLSQDFEVLKSSSPNDMSSWSGPGSMLFPVGNVKNTYPRLRVSPENEKCVLARTSPSTEVGDTLQLIRVNSVDDNSAEIQSKIAYYDGIDVKLGDVSIYICGFQIDNDGVYHIGFNYHDGYGGRNIGRAIGYMYSMPNIDGVATAGHYWFNAKGHTVSISTGWSHNDVGDCLQWMDDGYKPAFNPFIRYSWDSASTTTSAPQFYHGNTESMFMHPTQRVNNGIHNIKRACFTFHAYPNFGLNGDINNEVQGYMAYYDSGDPGAQVGNVGEGWVIHTVTSTATSVKGQGQLAWKGRYWGNMVIDNTPIYHIYGMVKPAGKEWTGGELCEWTSDNEGSSWDLKFLTKKSGVGIGMISTKADFSNDSIELIFNRGYDVLYLEDIKKYERMRTDGEDVRIVYGSGDPAWSDPSALTSKAEEIDMVTNHVNYDDTYLYFNLKHTIPSYAIYDTAGAYCVYYGRSDTADSFDLQGVASSNPDNIFHFFDNFEDYPVGSNVATPGHGGGWKGYNGAEFRIVDDISAHTNRIFGGKQSCTHINGVMEHTFPTISDVVVRFGVWDQDAIGGLTIQLYHTTGADYNYVYVTPNTSGLGYRFVSRTNPTFMDVGTGNSRGGATHEYIFYVSSAYGTSFRAEDGSPLIANESTPPTVGSSKLDLHTINGMKIWNGGEWNIDFIRVYKSYSTPDPFQVI